MIGSIQSALNRYATVAAARLSENWLVVMYVTSMQADSSAHEEEGVRSLFVVCKGAGGGIRTHNPLPGAVFEFSGRGMSVSIIVRDVEKNLALAGSAIRPHPSLVARVGVRVGVMAV